MANFTIDCEPNIVPAKELKKGDLVGILKTKKIFGPRVDEKPLELHLITDVYLGILKSYSHKIGEGARYYAELSNPLHLKRKIDLFGRVCGTVYEGMLYRSPKTFYNKPGKPSSKFEAQLREKIPDILEVLKEHQEKYLELKNGQTKLTDY